LIDLNKPNRAFHGGAGLPKDPHVSKNESLRKQTVLTFRKWMLLLEGKGLPRYATDNLGPAKMELLLP
jgi:hypothetical protein